MAADSASAQHTAPRRASSRILVIVMGGPAAGTLDIFAAAAINQAGLGTILQVIASGILGKTSYSGGTEAMVLGLALQEAMSLIIAGIYSVAAAKIPACSKGRCGLQT